MDAPNALRLMPFHVERQVIGAAERAGAQFAPERLDAGVLPEVAGQLVGASEAPHAALPYADVRFFTCVGGNG